jgi:plastocyanin/uncharacterized membrane protein YozB (DUF420 family)
MQALLGTRLSADINLVAQLLILIGLWVGFYFARTRQIPHHRNTQTTMVLVNLVFIALVMGTSFYSYVVAGGTTRGIVALLMMVHGFLGVVAQGTGIYLILRMRTQLIPPRWRVRNFKLLMRATLALWTVLVVLGVGIYYYRYLAPKPAAAASAPLEQLRLAGRDLLIHAAEMDDAARRQSLDTVHRHAEHVVNLIEGKGGPHYGDLDRDGRLEDPGDGTGLLNYLEQVVEVTKDEELLPLANRTRQWGERLRDISLSALEVTKIEGAAGPSREAASLARQINSDGIGPLADKARDRGVAVAPMATVPMPEPSSAPNTVTVLMDRFQFRESRVIIKRGWSVVWVNQEVAKHTVTSDDGKTYHSGSMPQGAQFSFTFDQLGTFPYYCRFHGDRGGVDMAGSVVVQP